LDLLDAVSDECALALIIDDVQWLDQTSASLFGSILEWMSGKKLLFVFTSRERPALLEKFSMPGQLLFIDLRPVGQETSRAIIMAVIGEECRPIPVGDLDWLVRTADGNPYFLQELSKHWVETGQRLEVPPSVSAVLDERISRLSPIALLLLQACAVLAENANQDRIERLLGFAPHELLTGINELALSGMIRTSMADELPIEVLQVRHDLLASAALRTLSSTTLAYLHRRCGTVLEHEVLGTSVSTSLLRSCAFHWHQSGDPARAYELGMKCANHLLEIGLPVDAAAALESALVFCVANEQRLEVLQRIVYAQRVAKDSKALRATIARIRILQGGTNSVDSHDDLEIVELEARRTTESEIGPIFARTLRCVYNTSLATAHRVSVAVVALKLASSLADLQEIQRIYKAVEALLPDPMVDHRARLQVAIVYNTMCGSLQEALRLATERVACERAEGTTMQLTNAMGDLAFVLRRTGPESETVRVLSEAYEITHTKRLHTLARDFAARLAAFFVDVGRTGVEPWISRAQTPHDEIAEVHIKFSHDAYRVKIALREKRVDDAERIVAGFPWTWLQERRGWLAAAHALSLQSKLAHRAPIPEVEEDVRHLQNLYRTTAKLGGQDYEVASLCAGLAYIGDELAARLCLRDYLNSKRRDTIAYSRELQRICRAQKAWSSPGSRVGVGST
jgi:hypothetical protein